MLRKDVYIIICTLLVYVFTFYLIWIRFRDPDCSRNCRIVILSVGERKDFREVEDMNLKNTKTLHKFEYPVREALRTIVRIIVHGLYIQIVFTSIAEALTCCVAARTWKSAVWEALRSRAASRRRAAEFGGIPKSSVPWIAFSHRIKIRVPGIYIEP